MAEIELKLAVNEDSLPALRHLLARLTDKPVRVQSLAATYYDTDTQAIEAHGFTLRIRREDGAIVQTVKQTRTSLTKRGEWSDRLSVAEPDLAQTKGGKRLRRLVRRPLRAQFRVEVERTTYAVPTGPDSLIEAAIDHGTIRSLRKRGGRQRICEIELELKQGPPAAIYALALELAKAGPVSIETRAKSARGYDLVTGREPVPVKARPVAIDDGMTLEKVLRESGRHLLAQYLRNVPAMYAGNSEAVHQMRVALRRLRGLLKAMKKVLTDESFDWADGRAQQLLNILGPAREWDVFAAEMVGPLTHRKDPPVRANGAFDRAVRLMRLKVHRDLHAAMGGGAHTLATLELLHWFERQGWRDSPTNRAFGRSLTRCAPSILDRQVRRMRKRGRNFAALPTEQRHKFRIAVKDLRYTVELFVPLLPKRQAKAYIKRMKPLQDRLGRMNDLASAHALLRDLERAHPEPAVARDGGVLLGWYERIAKASEGRLCKDVADLRAAKPPWA